MADALVSAVLEQLTSIVGAELQEEIKLLKGVKKEIQKLTIDFEAIKEVLDDAERRSVREHDVQRWVDELKDICYDMEDVLEELRTATILKRQLQPVKSPSCLKNKVSTWICSHLPWINRIVWNRKIALKIKDIYWRLVVVVNEKDKYNFEFTTGTTAKELERPKTTSFVDVQGIHGRGHVRQILLDRLLSESSQEEHNLSITAIVGMGGIGKTTLAWQAYRDENVQKHFNKRIWVCVSDPFNVTNIARAIIEAQGIKDRTPDLTDLESMLQEVSEAIENQKFLLVLDDVWNEDYKTWEPLRNSLLSGAKGSKILVTTRNERVAKMMEATNPIRLGALSTEACWSIFSQIAFFERSMEECKELEEIGRKISERSKGLPLAAKVLGGLMRFKRSKVEWQNVLDSDLWELEEANKKLDSVFMLSYYNLPSQMRRCFRYCAMFPEDHVIERDCLIQLWMANGFLGGREMEITGEEYIESLAVHSLFQDLQTDVSGRIQDCKMQGSVRRFALNLAGNECCAIDVYKDKEKPMEQEPAYAKLRHVRLVCEGEHSSTALSKFSINGLRTLVITELIVPEAETNVLRGLLCGLTSLRTLELSNSTIEELPVEIGNLMHLRYLGLENIFELEALPETVCDLCHLQTLKLTHCYEITALPGGIGKLSNLRHLQCELTNIKKLPKGVGELTSLRTLHGLNLSNRKQYFGIGDLEKLDCLRGDLRLNLLGEVRDEGEAKRAGLKNKGNLRSLTLSFSGSSGAKEARAKTNLSTAEALEPTRGLEKLTFENYDGRELPSWITSLFELKDLALHSCPNLKELHCDVERLPLQKVHIVDCPALEKYCQRKIMENRSLASVFDVTSSSVGSLPQS